MKYSINISSALSLKVRVGEFETFEEAKAQMARFIVDLIDRQKDDDFNAWGNLKEDFPNEIQTILNSYEETGLANFNDDIRGENDSVSYWADESNFEISGKHDILGYRLSIRTNAINMYVPAIDYYFTLTEDYDGGGNKLTVELLVDHGTVEVYNIIPDDVRSRLKPVAWDDE